MERATVFPLLPAETDGEIFQTFTSTVPVLSFFPPEGEPFAVAVTRSVLIAGSEETCDLRLVPPPLEGFSMVLCRQAMAGVDLSMSVTSSDPERCSLNGLPVGNDTPQPLSHGDILRLGDWSIRVVVPSETQPGFEGDLTCLPVLSLLQACADQDAEIRLVLRSGIRQATVFFRLGRIVHAEFREPGVQAKGVAAFRQIVELSTGSFWVNEQSLPTGKHTLDHPLDKLFLGLFEAADTDFQTGETFDFTPDKGVSA